MAKSMRVTLWVVAVSAVAACGRTAPFDYVFETDAGVIDPERSIEPWDEERCTPDETDRFTLPPAARRPIDVLFVVDDSSSMKGDQEALARNFRSFITTFQSNQVDFHLGAVTTDMNSSQRSGRLVSPFLTPETPDLAAAFTRMVNVGTQGSSNERGLAAAQAALSEPLTSGSNQDFLRAEADLGVAFISDEDDHSAQKPAEVATFLKGLKADDSSVVVAAIVGLEDNIFCDWASTGWQYVEVADAFGPRGISSRCSPDYAQVLSAMSGRLIATDCIVGLKRPLDEKSRVKVTVNGAPPGVLHHQPDGAYPNGSIEVVPCPPGGGTLEVVYGTCR